MGEIERLATATADSGASVSVALFARALPVIVLPSSVTVEPVIGPALTLSMLAPSPWARTMPLAAVWALVTTVSPVGRSDTA